MPFVKIYLTGKWEISFVCEQEINMCLFVHTQTIPPYYNVVKGYETWPVSSRKEDSLIENFDMK